LAATEVISGPTGVVVPLDQRPASRLATPRVASIDILRGLVMVLMAVDHAHFFFSPANSIPEYLPESSVPLFFTRFITHFCAPAFFFLAGSGAYMSFATGGQSISQVSRFFWTRGLWILVLSFTVIGYAWTSLFPFCHGGVMTAFALSMILMALTVRMPVRWIGILSVAIIAGHNLLDRIPITVFGKYAVIWSILHVPGTYPMGKTHVFFTLFTVIPWVGVMAAGFAYGKMLLRMDRQKISLLLGTALTVAFFVLRVFHLYGNSAVGLRGAFPDYYSAGPWTMQATVGMSIASFFNTLKYPASLQFLLMTLGPMLIALALLDKVKPAQVWARILNVFGRVPMFFYVLHLFFLHAMAVWVALAFHQRAAWLMYGGPLLLHTPAGYGHGLPFIYAMAISVVVLLYFPCKWFMNVKQEHKEWWWLRYL
jgi:uncharacterized membrane protein